VSSDGVQIGGGEQIQGRSQDFISTEAKG